MAEERRMEGEARRASAAGPVDGAQAPPSRAAADGDGGWQ